MRPHARAAWLLTILALATIPTANAGAPYVAETFDNDRGSFSYWENASTATYRDETFQFNPAFYDLANYTNNTIAFGNVNVLYYPASESFFSEFTPTNRQYETRSLINGTDYYNQTTTLTKTACVFSLCWPKVRICHNFELATPNLNATGYATRRANQTCFDSIGGTPNRIEHQLQTTSLYGLDRPTNFTQSYPFMPEPGSGPTYTNWQNADSINYLLTGSGVIVPANQTNYTHAYRLTTNAIAKDTSRIVIEYRFGTFATAARDANITRNITDNGGTFETILGKIFGAARTALTFVFGFFEGGAETAKFLSTAITVVIGVPLFAIALFLANPAKFLYFHTMFLLAVGIVRYAFGSDLSAIWETAITIWKALFRWVLGFAKWLYETLIALGSLIASNNIILATVIAIAIGATLLTLLT